MSQEQVEQFADCVKKDPALYQKLVADTKSTDEFVDKAVAMASEAGFSFTRDEADAFIQSHLAAQTSGELSDLQLESVAGGGLKTGTQTQTNTSTTSTTSTTIEITDYGFGVTMPRGASKVREKP